MNDNLFRISLCCHEINKMQETFSCQQPAEIKWYIYIYIGRKEVMKRQSFV